MSDLNKKFTEIYNKNYWGSHESKSGTGSELKNTKTLIGHLSLLFAILKPQSILDIPCGDFNWMKTIDFSGIKYIGADIVEDLIEDNKRKFPDVDFRVADITKDTLPKVDLVIVRDCLVHLSIENIFKSIENIKSSQSRWLLTTCFVDEKENGDINDGAWRTINLMAPPFYFEPHFVISENCQERYPLYDDKSMVLFDLDKIKL